MTDGLRRSKPYLDVTTMIAFWREETSLHGVNVLSDAETDTRVIQ